MSDVDRNGFAQGVLGRSERERLERYRAQGTVSEETYRRQTGSGPCPVCGPQPEPYVHAICHPDEHRSHGCGHPLKDHAASLRCRICGEECGLYCRPPGRRLFADQAKLL